MTNMERKIETVLNNLDNLYRTEIEVVNSSFMNLVTKMDILINKSKKKFNNALIYYEENPIRNKYTRNILVIKFDDNEIVFSCKFKTYKKEDANSIKLERVKGPYAFDLLKSIMKEIVVFFHESKNHQMENLIEKPIVHQADFNTRKVCMIYSVPEKVFSLDNVNK